MSRPANGLRRELGGFDFTLLVIGAVIGADVYVVAGLGAQYLGPAQLVAWAIAGVLAALIGLAFIQCAAICPEVGGSYAYARAAYGPFVGFLAGWALYLGEWVALPVFPLAFSNYLAYFLPIHSVAISVLVKVLLVAAVTSVNLKGVRGSGRLNDVLTLTKLVPLALLMVAALAFIVARPSTAGDHLTPFVPLGWGGFGSAMVLIFWAYAGFELAVLPAGEVEAPQRTLPRGLLIGMAVATVFYLLTAVAVVVGLPWQAAAASARPLADALRAILAGLGLPGGWGPALMSLGALISIVGVYDVFTLSVARLSYALAADGLFPPPFAWLRARSGTPWVGLAFQAVSALVVALIFDISQLIAGSVLFLGLCYLITAAAALKLLQREPERALRLPGLRVALVLAGISGAYLAAQAPPRQLALGATAMSAGVLVYAVRRGTWHKAAVLTAGLHREEQRFERWARRQERWLLQFLRRHA